MTVDELIQELLSLSKAGKGANRCYVLAAGYVTGAFLPPEQADEVYFEHDGAGRSDADGECEPTDLDARITWRGKRA